MATHCQICEREIKLITRDIIAHHGFRRPGKGWQSASCQGARELPWEVSCEALRTHVSQLHKRREEMHARATGPVERLSLQIGTESLYNSVPKMTEVTEATLLQVAAEHPKFCRYNGKNFYSNEPLSWTELVARWRKERLADIEQLDHYLQHHEKRLANWKPVVEGVAT